MFCKKGVLKICKVYSKKPVPVALNFIWEETLLQVFEFRETFKNTFFNRTPPVIDSGFSFKLIFLSFYIKMTGP